MSLEDQIEIIDEHILHNTNPQMVRDVLDKTLEILAFWPSRDEKLLRMLATAAHYDSGVDDPSSHRSYLGMCMADLRDHYNRNYETREEARSAFRELFETYSNPPKQATIDLSPLFGPA